MKRFLLPLLACGLLIAPAAAAKKPPAKVAPVVSARKAAAKLLGQMARGELPAVCAAMTESWRARYPQSECEPLSRDRALRLADERAQAYLTWASSAARGLAQDNGNSYPLNDLPAAIEKREPILSIVFVQEAAAMAGKSDRTIGLDEQLSNDRRVVLYVESNSGVIWKISSDLESEEVSRAAAEGIGLPPKAQPAKVSISAVMPIGRGAFQIRAVVFYTLGEQEEVYLQLVPYRKLYWKISQLDSAMMVQKPR